MICFQMLTLVRQRISLLADIYVLKTLASYASRAPGYKYSRFYVSGRGGEEKRGAFRN